MSTVPETKLLTPEQLNTLIRDALVIAQRVSHSRFCDEHPTGQSEVCKVTTEAIPQLDSLCATVRAMEKRHSSIVSLIEAKAAEWAKYGDLTKDDDRHGRRVALHKATAARELAQLIGEVK